MKTKPSPLELLDIAITAMDYKFIAPVDEVEPNSIFKQYEIDVDFFIHTNEYLMVQITTNINKVENPLPGYSLFAEATCIFKFNESVKIDTEIKNNLEGYSSIYMSLNALRGFISNLTANAPIGRYVLPSIDLNDLIATKRKEMQKRKKPKRQ